MLPQKPFLFLRHGQTDWNVAGRMQGHTDIPLNETGIAQAHAASQTLHGHAINRIIASPLSRTRHTAEIIAQAHNLPLEFDDLLKERPFGSFEGQITKDALAAHGLEPTASISTILPPDAEQWPQTKLRAQTAISKWLKTYPEDNLLFVSHGAVFRALYEALGGPRLEAKNATPYHFQPSPEGLWHLTTL